MGFFARKVRVTLVDDRSGSVLGVTKLDASALPASFFASTTMHVREAEWSVVSADPMTRDGYEKTRRLVLRLRPVERVDPQTILFSLPTICDQLPTSEGADANGSEVGLREDDWRQIELVAASLVPLVEAELAAIRSIYADERVGVGFRKIHVRSSLPQPIADGTVSSEEVLALAGARMYLPLRFSGSGRRVTDGVAVRLDGQGALYGLRHGESVAVVGFYPGPPSGLVELERFADRNGLVVVDWCRAALGRAGDASFKAVCNGEAVRPS
jgi:hypothetical protein